MHRHKHKAVYEEDRAFMYPVAAGEENPAAHGNITRHQWCSCGATRKVNINGRHREIGPWVWEGRTESY